MVLLFAILVSFHHSCGQFHQHFNSAFALISLQQKKLNLCFKHKKAWAKLSYEKAAREMLVKFIPSFIAVIRWSSLVTTVRWRPSFVTTVRWRPSFITTIRRGPSLVTTVRWWSRLIRTGMSIRTSVTVLWFSSL